MSDLKQLAEDFAEADAKVSRLQEQLSDALEERRLARESLLDATRRLPEDFDD